MNRTELLDLLKTRFDESELQDLCFNLGLAYEDLKGEGRANKARELVLYCERHTLLGRLEETCRRMRPDAFGQALAPVPPRQPRTDNQASIQPTIGIITALPKEYVAVKALLENGRDYVVQGPGAGRRYWLAQVPATNGGSHAVALSLADMGNNIAATRATLLLEHFQSATSIIMVGIAGGVPDPSKPDEHVRLGDVVVSNQGGVVQYDFTKETKKKRKVEIT